MPPRAATALYMGCYSTYKRTDHTLPRSMSRQKRRMPKIPPELLQRAEEQWDALSDKRRTQNQLFICNEMTEEYYWQYFPQEIQDAKTHNFLLQPRHIVTIAMEIGDSVCRICTSYHKARKQYDKDVCEGFGQIYTKGVIDLMVNAYVKGCRTTFSSVLYMLQNKHVNEQYQDICDILVAHKGGGVSIRKGFEVERYNVEEEKEKDRKFQHDKRQRKEGLRRS
eukprot:1598776-Rhodomonas_salina.1